MHPKLCGDFGEKLAVAFLKNKDYEIIERNFRVRGGELDIVAKAPSGVLVFVEVKTRSSNEFGHGDESIGRMKIEKMIRAIERFLASYKESDPDYRIDIIEIELQRESRNGPAANNDKNPLITHFKDIEI